VTEHQTLDWQIDELGAFGELIDALKEEQKTLAAAVRKALAKRNDGRYVGQRFQAELLEVRTASIGDLETLKAAASKRFLDCIRADVAACREVLGDEAVDAIAVVKTSRRLVVTAK